jgi:hypothetical protein
MATVSCHSCGLPRAEELVGVIPCPVCGASGPVLIEEPPAPVPGPGVTPSGGLTSPGSPGGAIRVPAPPASSAVGVPPVAHLAGSAGGMRPTSVGGLVGFIAGLATGVFGLLGFQAAFPPGSARGPHPVTQASRPDPAPEPDSQPAGPAIAPPPREVETRSALATPTDPTPGVTPPQPPAPGGVQPEPIPPNPFRPAAPLEMRLDNPDGESTPVVKPGGNMVLRGRVKVLRVPGLESGAVLDASELEAAEVIVAGKIDGGSRLWVKAPNGRVTFQGRIDSRATVDVQAPGGTVTFANPTTVARDGSKIDGGAVAEVTARVVEFHGRITGDGTRVVVSLTAGGRLAFAEIDGLARLEYRKADPDDPDPAVSWGTVRAPAVVARTE